MTWRKDNDFADKVGELCIQHYSTKLTKKGKPQAGKEWTLMAAVVMATSDEGRDLNTSVHYNYVQEYVFKIKYRQTILNLINRFEE